MRTLALALAAALPVWLAAPAANALCTSGIECIRERFGADRFLRQNRLLDRAAPVVGTRAAVNSYNARRTRATASVDRVPGALRRPERAGMLEDAFGGQIGGALGTTRILVPGERWSPEDEMAPAIGGRGGSVTASLGDTAPDSGSPPGAIEVRPGIFYTPGGTPGMAPGAVPGPMDLESSELRGPDVAPYVSGEAALGDRWNLPGSVDRRSGTPAAQTDLRYSGSGTGAAGAAASPNRPAAPADRQHFERTDR